MENLNKTSIKISSHTGSRVGRISFYIESLRLILVSVLFASNAYAQIPPTAFIDLEYFYDGVSNVTGVTDRIDSQNNCFMQYDSLDRLINADGPWGVGSFTYDSVGNRTSKDIAGENVNYSYGSDNRLSGVVHDANGNIIDDGVFTYTYDSENRLIQVTNGVDVITYEYDGDGRRIKRVTNSETTYYAYGVGLNVLTEFSGQRVPKFDYIYAGNKNIARVNYDGSGVKEGKTFYHSDHLGSNIAITDATSTVEWDRVYLPYGEGFNDPNSDFLTNTHQYTAKELDEDSGLYYYGARYYNPSIGRFMSVDPAGGDITEPQSWNRYAYVQNNPFIFTDPDGEFLETAWDGFNIALGVYSLKQNLTRGKYFDALIDAGGIVVDSAAALTPFVPGGVGLAIKASRAGKAVDKAFDLAGTFRNRKSRDITLKSGRKIQRAFEEGVTEPIGSFYTRGTTARRIKTTEDAIGELNLGTTSGAEPDFMSTFEVLFPIEAKIGFVENGGKNAIQIFIKKQDALSSLKEIERIPLGK